MLRSNFGMQLDALHQEILEMGKIVEKQVNDSIEALVNKDTDLAKVVIKNDDKVDIMEREIEDRAIKLIATQQPLASDLRMLFTLGKIASELERISDYAVDIAKITRRLREKEYEVELVKIPKMSVIAQQMLSKSLTAYVEADAKKAYSLGSDDKALDILYVEAFNSIISHIKEGQLGVTASSEFLLAAKHLERIGDRAVNIGEWTVYLVTGEHVDFNDDEE